MPDDNFTTLRTRLHTTPDPALPADIEAAVAARREARSGHTDWALLCEEAGLLPLAFREFQLALRDNPNDPIAGFRLAQHYRERGDTGRAAGLLERLLQVHPAHEDWLALYVDVLHEDGALPRIRAALDRAVQAGLAPERAAELGRHGAPAEEEAEEETTLAPSDADCVRFQGLFAGREDVHARQWARAGGEGGYSPVHEPLTPAVVRNHLLGTYTVGVYPIRLDGAVYVLRPRSGYRQGRPGTGADATGSGTLAARLCPRRGLAPARCLRELAFVPVLEDSGFKGRHLWVFLEQPEPAEVLHLLGRLLLAWQQPHLAQGLHLEFFPKQAARTGKGLGNLIKLPLGIHRRTGRRAALTRWHRQAPASAPRRPAPVVRAPQKSLHAAIDRLKGLVKGRFPKVGEPPDVSPPARRSEGRGRSSGKQKGSRPAATGAGCRPGPRPTSPPIRACAICSPSAPSSAS